VEAWWEDKISVKLRTFLALGIDPWDDPKKPDVPSFRNNTTGATFEYAYFSDK